MVMDEKREGDNEWRKRSYMIIRLYKHIAAIAVNCSLLYPLVNK